MTNEEILQQLEEEIHLRGFSPHTLCQTGVQKPATIHTLRHCFATQHLLENGTDLCQIKISWAHQYQVHRPIPAPK
jgi:site-specific recombinase XerD